MSVHALVVGISKYGFDKQDLEGPVFDALRFAEWLRDKHVPPENIKLFLSPTEKGEGDCRKEAARLDLDYHPAERAFFDDYLDKSFPSGDELFFFWSGHGLVNNADERYLLFSDFTDAARHNHLDVNNTLAFLRGKKFLKQIGFIDACAKSVGGDLGSSKRQLTPGRAEQAYLFATSPGQTAADYTTRRTSRFSEQLLEVLKKEPFPPDPTKIIQEMLRRFENDAEQRPQCVAHKNFSSGESVIRYPNSPRLYLDWLRDQTGEINLDELKINRLNLGPPTMDALYLPLMTAGFSGEEESEKGHHRKRDGQSIEGREPVLLEKALRNRRLIIEGGAGTGKTTFLHRIAWRLCRRDPENDEMSLPFNGFPLFVRIRELDEHVATTLTRPDPRAPATATSSKWIAHFLASNTDWGLDEQFFADKLLNPESVLLLDGLDEAANSDRRDKIAQLIRDAASVHVCRYVVTARPGAVESLRGFSKIEIAPLQEEQIEKFLAQWCLWIKSGNRSAADSYCQGLREAVAATDPRLPENPLMLTALCVVYLQEKHLPEERAALYEAIMQWLGLQAARRLQSYRSSDVLEWFGALALRMQKWEGGHTVLIAIENAAEALEEGGFPARGPQTPYQAALDFLNGAQRDSGIVTLKGRQLEFWHRSFQEYLAARALTNLGRDLGREACAFLYSPDDRAVLPLAAGRLAVDQKIRLNELFDELIRHALARDFGGRVHAVAVLGSMLADLRSTSYQQKPAISALYRKLLNEILDIFKKGAAASVPLKSRVDAAEALGAAGDPRLRTPGDEDYWVEIKGGSFTMGAQKTDPSNHATYDPDAYEDETPRRVELNTFHIGRFPVTVQEYRKYVEDTPTAEPGDWEEQLLHPSRPVVSLTWHQATAYCQWASTKWRVTLPSEEQWEFAARGREGRRYPWGNEEPAAEKANFDDTKIGAPTPVGLFPAGNTPEGVADMAGNTPEGVADMAGNVWEWTSSKYNEEFMGVRGASFSDDAGRLRAAYRVGDVPGNRLLSLGFRCVRE